MALSSIYTEPSKKQKKTQPQNQNGGILGTAKQTAKDRINAAINARSPGIAHILRAPNKKEKPIHFLLAKLPPPPHSPPPPTPSHPPLPAPPPPAPLKTQATIDSAGGSGPAPLKVDSEGGVQAKEWKTRFIAPLISLVLASRAADNDAGREHGAASSGADGNIAGRTLGGGSGFGLLGAAISQSSRYVGMAFGYYGLAWSVHSNVIAKGGEVQFENNAMMDIRFGARPPAPGSKFKEAPAASGQ